MLQTTEVKLRAGNQFSWTRNMRVLIYETLVAKFGPFSGWESAQYPSKDEKETYHETLRALAHLFSLQQGLDTENGEKWTAVENQVKWATTIQGTIGNVPNYVLNAAAAHDAGFITAKDMANSLSQFSS